MKPFDRNLLCSLAMIASASSGCGPDHERQMVFTAPRSPTTRVDPKDGVRGKVPPVARPAPIDTSIPPSNGIDVPMIEPE